MSYSTNFHKIRFVIDIAGDVNVNIFSLKKHLYAMLFYSYISNQQ